MSKIGTYIGYLMMVLSLLTSVSSCTGVDDIAGGDASVTDYPVILSAGSPYTRISLNDTAIAWEEDDRIQINAIAADGNTGVSELTYFSEVEGKDGHFASFSGFVSMPSLPKDCYFTYPVSSSTAVDPDTGRISLYYNNQTGLHEPFMYAVAPYDENGMTVKLKHVGAILEIDVRIDEVAQLTFAGNRLEKLSPAIINPNTGEVSFTSQANVQITVPVQKGGKTYIAVPPVNFEKGFSIICSDADAGKSMIRTYSTDGSLGSGYDFTEKAGRIIPITIDGTLESFNVSSSEASYEHTKSGNLLTGTSVKFTMSKQGASDKLIEEWGATMVNQDGVTVREIKYTNADPISGDEVQMDVVNDWKLLSGGTYIFTPYYKVYGQKVSLNSQTITVADPGIELILNGQTSYDKFDAGKVDEANSHTNTKIEGVSFTTNVHPDIISYTATLSDENGTDSSLGTPSVSSGTGSVSVSYGDRTRTTFKSYQFKVALKVGAITVSRDRTFHITGLPLQADFATDPSVWQNSRWTYMGIAGYSNKWVTFRKGSGGLRSPGFHIPASFKVKTQIDAHTNCSNQSDRDIHITSCSAQQSSAITSGVTTYRPNKSSVLADNLKSQGYSNWITGFELTSVKNSMLYSVLIDNESFIYLNQTRVGIFKINVQYQSKN